MKIYDWKRIIVFLGPEGKKLAMRELCYPRIWDIVNITRVAF